MSPTVTSISAGSTPSASAVTWASTVSMPCPSVAPPAATVTRRPRRPPPARARSRRRRSSRGSTRRRCRPPALLARLGRLARPVLVAGTLERRVEQAREVAGVDLDRVAEDGKVAVVRQVAGGEQVAPAQREAVDPELVRGGVEEALAGERRLVAARPAVRAARRLVGHRDVRAALVGRDAVRPREHAQRSARRRRRRGCGRRRRCRARPCRAARAARRRRRTRPRGGGAAGASGSSRRGAPRGPRSTSPGVRGRGRGTARGSPRGRTRRGRRTRRPRRCCAA